MSDTSTDKIEKAIDEAAQAVAVEVSKLATLGASNPNGDPIGIENLLEVPVKVTVEVGRSRLTLAELVKLQAGSLVTLDREAHEPVDILVNGKIVARGEVVTIDQRYGVRITTVERA
ncbi:MAG: flagellar motor switch protein FliN [Planctomycetes bacterium]|nr:flagellar motor switch protein FliN [Planctomycetota bacterium]